MAAPPAPSTERISDLLLRDGYVNKEQIDRALREAKTNTYSVTYNLIKLGAIDELELTKIIARVSRMPAVDLSKFEVDPRIIKLVPADIATKHLVLPLKRDGRTLTVAIADPTNLGILEDLKFITRYDIFPVLAGEVTLRSVIEKQYDAGDAAMSNLLEEFVESGDVEVVEEKEEDVSAAALAAAVDDAPVVKLINAVLTDAVKRGASDIHFECFEHELRVRYRVDGALQEVMKPPLKLKAALISRFKIMAQLNIAERRVPQDGRIKLKMGNKVIDYRVSTLPTLFGEKVVLRILDKGNLTLELEKFGIEPRAERELMEAVSNPYGMVLVTGPTGSGKTVSLYTCLNILNKPGVNISTAEDPSEINLPGVNQVNMNEKAGLTFAVALKAFLRQDPDVIMVGEIRDLETADIAIKAAQTGHMVMSTLHTNDAPTTLTRMMNMGIPTFNIASSVILITAQRLARRLCPNCKAPLDVPRKALLEAGFKPDELDGTWTPYKPVGCSACNNGYKGRVGIYQVMPISEEIQRIILRGGTALDIAQQASKEGVRNLRESGLLKVKLGFTSLEEVLSVTNE
jgi:type IV pilus assembly protein PilB